MLSTNTIFFETSAGKRELLISPFPLESKEVPNFKSRTNIKLFFYENWIDDEYRENLQQEFLVEKFKADNYVINYGQDFGRFYVGSIDVDFENKTYSNLNGEPGKFNDEELKALTEALEHPEGRTRQITVFTPTRP